MRVILGIGNPENRYTFTKHNLGFLILDNFAKEYSLNFKPSTANYYYSSGSIDNDEFILVKPATYVNNSGLAAVELLKAYDINIKDLLVVQDDLNLEFGSLRIRASGGDGGHNGISSIIYHLNSNQFPRLRFGIGSEFEKGNMAEFVLSNLNEHEFETLNQKKSIINSLLVEFIKGGTIRMLNFYSTIINSDSNNHLLNQSGD
ncbi:MAG: aminoacyl-tRNA hydrolase [Ignavibacteriales bacterium]|nr:MAG: aminoacyl-tRNA hydrolase [Ignavibacteriales bacterium]